MDEPGLLIELQNYEYVLTRIIPSSHHETTLIALSVMN